MAIPQDISRNALRTWPIPPRTETAEEHINSVVLRKTRNDIRILPGHRTGRASNPKHYPGKCSHMQIRTDSSRKRVDVSREQAECSRNFVEDFFSCMLQPEEQTPLPLNTFVLFFPRWLKNAPGKVPALPRSRPIPHGLLHVKTTPVPRRQAVIPL